MIIIAIILSLIFAVDAHALDKKLGATNSFKIIMTDASGNGIAGLDVNATGGYSDFEIKVKCGSDAIVTMVETGDTIVDEGGGVYDVTTNDTLTTANENECLVWAVGTGNYSVATAVPTSLIAKSPIKFKAIGATMDAVKVAADYTGSIVADGSNTASTFKTSLTQSVDSHWIKAGVIITSGSLAGQVRQITAYNGTSKFITVSPAFTSYPGDSATFRIMNQ